MVNGKIEEAPRIVAISQLPCRFAPEGRDVYSLAVLFFTTKLRRSAIAFACSPIVPLLGFAPNGARSCVCTRSYKHLAPLERKRISLLDFQLESTIHHSPFTTKKKP